MNSELIETFVTVANAGNITKSADILFVSQATVSHRIKQLEEKLGVQLILRNKGSKQTNLTIAGKNFLPLAQSWLRLNDEGWKHQWKLWNIGSVVKGKVLPANEWVTVETPFSKLNKNAVIQAAFGYPAGKLKDGEKVVFEIRNMEFTNAGQSDENRRQNLAFDQWRRNYSPDYSDSSKYLDPPREGALALARTLAATDHRPERVVYVSCNPATLARDCAILHHEGGWHIRAAGIMNMFPHTGHVESIAVLEPGPKPEKKSEEAEAIERRIEASGDDKVTMHLDA